MKIDTAKLDRKIYALKESAKRRNGYTDNDLSDFLTISSNTIRNMTSNHKLYTMRICDIAILEQLAGESLDLFEV